VDGKFWTDKHTETTISTDLERFFLNQHWRAIASRVILVRLDQNFSGAELDAKITPFAAFFRYSHLAPRYFYRSFLEEFLQLLVRSLLRSFQAGTFYSLKRFSKI
jgi:hypothetical protein